MHPIAKLSRPCPPRRASLLAQKKVVTCARRRFSRQGGPRLRVRLTDLREASRVSRRRGGTVAASRGLIVLKKLIPNIVEYLVSVYQWITSI